MASRRNPPNADRPTALARAMALWRDKHFDEAIRSFDEAVRESPNDPGVLIDAARALGARYQIGRSMALLAKAARLASRRADLQHAIAESYRMLGRTAEAEACFRNACRLAPARQSELELARICERRHAVDEAAQLVARALQSDPRSPAALLLCARLQRRRGEVDDARTTLAQLIEVAADRPKLLAEAYGELSALLDSTGEYDEAWDAIVRCKTILQGHEQPAWNAAQFVLGRCSRMIDAVTPSHFTHWRAAAEAGSKRQLALLTGFPRTGTTLLEQVLDAHPDVVSSEETEIFSVEVFSRLGHPPEAPIEQLLDRLSPRQTLEARAMYLDFTEQVLGQPIGSRLHLDKNPAMTLMIPAIRRVFPELKLLIALRDPRDVVVSCFMRYLPLNPVSVCFLTLERTVDRYLLDMGAWLKMREMVDDWLEVRYENVVTNLDRESRRALDFLNLPWDDSVLRYRARSGQKPVRSPSYEEVARPLFTTSIGRWQNYHRQLEPLLARLAPITKALGYEA